MQSLEQYKVDSSVPAAYYIRDFISPREEAHLIEKILTEAQLNDPVKGYVKLESRTLQRFGGEVVTRNTPAGPSTSVLIPSTIPPHLLSFPPILARLEQYGIFDDAPHKAPNHVLVNIYQPGQGIGPHEDGPAYHDTVATLSLGGQAILDYLRYKDDDKTEGQGRAVDPRPICSVLQEPRSLLVTRGKLYGLLHTMPAVRQDIISIRTLGNWHLLSEETRQLVTASPSKSLPRTLRISLTYRDVKKVSKAFGRPK